MILKVKKSYLMQAVKKALKQDIDFTKQAENKQMTDNIRPDVVDIPKEEGSVNLSKERLTQIAGTLYGSGWTVEQIAQTVKMPVEWVQKAVDVKYWDKMAKKVHFMPQHQIDKQEERENDRKTRMQIESKKPKIKKK